MWKLLCLIVGFFLLLPISAYGTVATQDSGTYTGEAVTINFGAGLDVSGDYSVKTVDSTLWHATVEVSNAEIKALRATPKEIIAAPGNDYFIEVVACVLIYDYHDVSAFTEVDADLTLAYNDGLGTVWIGDYFQMTDFIDESTDMILTWTQTCVNPHTVCSVIEKNVVLLNFGTAEIAGNAAADNTLNVYITYRLVKGGIEDCTLGY